MIGRTYAGWGVLNADGELDVRTVSPTRRAAMVNYLMLNAGVPVTNQHSDAAIEQMFAAAVDDNLHALVSVRIKLDEPQDKGE